MQHYPITAVSGYWPVTNKHHNAFDHWLPQTLQINCPYVLYSREEDMERLKRCRGDKPTLCVKKDIPEIKVGCHGRGLSGLYSARRAGGAASVIRASARERLA